MNPATAPRTQAFGRKPDHTFVMLDRPSPLVGCVLAFWRVFPPASDHLFVTSQQRWIEMALP